MSGSQIYANETLRTDTSGQAELLFTDRTNLTVGSLTEVRLDRFVYDPNGTPGKLNLTVNSGSFRFVTGVQPHDSYQVKVPFATVQVRGTEFLVNIMPTGVQIELVSGELSITTSSGKVIDLTIPGTVVTINSQGDAEGPTPTSTPIVNFADLGSLPNLTVADALSAFQAVTGDVSIAATNGAGGGDRRGRWGWGWHWRRIDWLWNQQFDVSEFEYFHCHHADEFLFAQLHIFSKYTWEFDYDDIDDDRWSVSAH